MFSPHGHWQTGKHTRALQIRCANLARRGYAVLLVDTIGQSERTFMGHRDAASHALLYAGASWFGGTSHRLAAPGADVVIVFDRSLKITAGPAPGTSVVMQFPEPLRPEIEMRCRLALRGEHTHFECEHGGARLAFDIAPIQSIQHVVIYGVLISGSGLVAPATAPAPVTTVA